MTATDYPTYQAYCLAKFSQGYSVIPESLWNALKKDKYMHETISD